MMNTTISLCTLAQPIYLQIQYSSYLVYTMYMYRYFIYIYRYFFLSFHNCIFVSNVDLEQEIALKRTMYSQSFMVTLYKFVSPELEMLT